jgi:hypothetical protein
MNNPLLEKYKHFVNLIILDRLKDSTWSLYNEIVNIEVIKYDVNGHTGKYYPHFLITVSGTIPHSLSLRESIADKIRRETEKFFPDIFNIGQAWLSFKKSDQ